MINEALIEGMQRGTGAKTNSQKKLELCLAPEDGKLTRLATCAAARQHLNPAMCGSANRPLRYPNRSIAIMPPRA